jgi:hypothetical protein
MVSLEYLGDTGRVGYQSSRSGSTDRRYLTKGGLGVARDLTVRNNGQLPYNMIIVQKKNAHPRDERPAVLFVVLHRRVFDCTEARSANARRVELIITAGRRTVSHAELPSVGDTRCQVLAHLGVRSHQP